MSIGSAFGTVNAGTQAAQAAGPNHGHGISGFSGAPGSLHGHPHGAGHGGHTLVEHGPHFEHSQHGGHGGHGQHGKNHAPWLAVHHIIKAI